MSKALDARLSLLEAAQRAKVDALAIPQWRALYSAGADVATRNAVAGPAWCAAAIERQRLALETLEAYDETFNYQPSGTS